MDLKNVLGQIQPNRCNLAHGWLPLMVMFDNHHFGTQMPGGGHPPHQFEICFFGSRSDSLAPSINYSSCRDVVQLYSVRHSGDMARIRDTAPANGRGFLLCAPLTAARSPQTSVSLRQASRSTRDGI